MDNQIVDSQSNYDLEILKRISFETGIRKELIQGAGGNTSYKIGNTLWIKASGTKLENAKKESIFIGIQIRKKDNPIASWISIAPFKRIFIPFFLAMMHRRISVTLKL